MREHGPVPRFYPRAIIKEAHLVKTDILDIFARKMRIFFYAKKEVNDRRSQVITTSMGLHLETIDQEETQRCMLLEDVERR
jgi:hypothetical protein